MTTEDDNTSTPPAAPLDPSAPPPLQAPRRLRAKQQTRGIRPAEEPNEEADEDIPPTGPER